MKLTKLVFDSNALLKHIDTPKNGLSDMGNTETATETPTADGEAVTDDTAEQRQKSNQVLADVMATGKAKKKGRKITGNVEDLTEDLLKKVLANYFSGGGVQLEQGTYLICFFDGSYDLGVSSGTGSNTANVGAEILDTVQLEKDNIPLKGLSKENLGKYSVKEDTILLQPNDVPNLLQMKKNVPFTMTVTDEKQRDGRIFKRVQIKDIGVDKSHLLKA